MIVLPPQLARSWEEKSLQGGARIKDLMRQAVAGALRELQPFLPKPSTALILVGPGHNGDDAFLLGLELKELGWEVDFLLSRNPTRRTHPDSRVKPKHWKKALIWPAKSSRFLKTKAPRLVIDGLLGLGATPPPRPAEAAILNWISNEKRNSTTTMISLLHGRKEIEIH
jgi:NAD(P)H-hydrate repair Nnr-like enzyme with NAD(P)H-hydrate epimerase domain